MKSPSVLLRSLAVAALVLLGTAAFAWQPTTATFSDTTGSPETGANSWSTGTVSLVDQFSGARTETVSSLRPGDVVERCIRVYYTGDAPASVRIFVQAGNSTGDVGGYAWLTLQEGTGGGAAVGGVSTSCEGFAPSATLHLGFLSDFVSARTTFATGVGAWTETAQNEYRTYRFHLEIRGGHGAANRTGTTTFTWEARTS